MAPRRVLLLTYHFPPSAASGSFRLLGFAKHLPRAGWQVTVVAPPGLPFEPVDPALVDELPPGVDVRAVPYPTHAWKPIRILFPFAVWLLRARRAVSRLVRESRPDVVVTSGPPHVVHLLGLWLRTRHAIPWVADFRDPWVNDGLDRPRRWIDRWFLWCERRVYRYADRILANAPNAMDVYRAQYPAYRDKVILLTNGFDPRPGRPSPSPPTRTEITLVHAGEIYLGRDPRPLFDAMSDVNRDPAWDGARVRLHIYGRAEVGRLEIERAIAQRGLTGDVVFHGQVPYEQSIEAIYAADINVLFDTPNRTFGVPAKLYEYFGGARPILALAEQNGDTARILRESGLLHRIAHPQQAGEIRTALAGLVTAVVSGADVAGPPPGLDRFTRESLARSLAGIMDEVLGCSPRSGAVDGK